LSLAVNNSILIVRVLPQQAVQHTPQHQQGSVGAKDPLFQSWVDLSPKKVFSKHMSE
jgi:hypothetical protein